MRQNHLWALPLLLVMGCGVPGRSPLKEVDRKALIPPEAAKDGYGMSPKRTWVPAVEALYQRLMAPGLGTDRLVAVQFGTQGKLASALALVRGPSGTFRVVHAGIRFGHLQTVDWAEEELPELEGDILWAQIEQLEPEKVASDESLARFVRGQGAVHLAYRRAERLHEAVGWAPDALAQQEIEPGYRALLALLREAAPPYPAS